MAIPRWVAGAVGALVLIALASAVLSGARASRWAVRAAEAVARAEVLATQATEAAAEADSVSHEALVAHERAHRAQAEVERLRAELRPVDEAPEECLEDLLARDRVIVAQDSVIVAQDAAFGRQMEAYVALRSAFGDLQISHDSLSAVLEDRPGPTPTWRKLIPDVGIGLTAGVCSNGGLCAAVGPTLTWRLR